MLLMLQGMSPRMDLRLLKLAGTNDLKAASLSLLPLSKATLGEKVQLSSFPVADMLAMNQDSV